MTKLKVVTQDEVYDFIQQHPTYWERLAVSDDDFEDFFNQPITQRVKSKIWRLYSLSLSQIIDTMEAMELVDYHIALYLIKKHGWCLPMRVRNWGYKEPDTLNELEGNLEILANRWHNVYDGALSRVTAIRTQSKKIIFQTTWLRGMSILRIVRLEVQQDLLESH